MVINHQLFTEIVLFLSVEKIGFCEEWETSTIFLQYLKDRKHVKLMHAFVFYFKVTVTFLLLLEKQAVRWGEHHRTI